MRIHSCVLIVVCISMGSFGASGQMNTEELLDLLLASEAAIYSGSFTFEGIHEHSDDWVAQGRANLDAARAARGLTQADLSDPTPAALDKVYLIQGRYAFTEDRSVLSHRKISGKERIPFFHEDRYTDRSEGTVTCFDRIRGRTTIKPFRRRHLLEIDDPMDFWYLYNDGVKWSDFLSNENHSVQLDAVEEQADGSSLYRLKIEIPTRSGMLQRNVWLDPSVGLNVVRAESLSVRNPNAISRSYEAKYQQILPGLFFPSQIRFIGRPDPLEEEERYEMSITGTVVLNQPIPEEVFAFVPSEDISIIDLVHGITVPAMKEQK